MTTLKDVAKQAGVSMATVSIIINGKAAERHISATTVAKVQGVIQELQYQPSISARALRTSQANKFTVGLYWAADFRASFLARFIKGIQEEAMDSRVNFVICPYKPGELIDAKELYHNNAFNAVIIANVNGKDLEYIQSHQIPIPTILYNRHAENYHTVSIDNHQLGVSAAKHLLERNIQSAAVICMNNLYYSMSHSTDGFIKEFTRQGGHILPEPISIKGYTADYGYQAARELLKNQELPQAIFCDIDSSAIGVLSYLHKEGLRIPDDIQVIAIGLSDSILSRYLIPSLTVVEVPVEEMAHECCHILNAIKAHTANDPIHIDASVKLLQRESTQML